MKPSTTLISRRVRRSCRLIALAAALCSALSAQSLDTHPVRLDGEGKLISWFTPQDQAFGHVAKLSANFIKNAMVGPINPANGLPMIYTHCEYDPDTFVGSPWPNHPAGRNSMLAESMRLYYQYSGDAAVLDAVTDLLDHQLAFGTTPATGYVWANVPYSTAAAGNATYGTDNLVEGVGVLEPDKIGELGYHGYLQFYKITGKTAYRDAAIACADSLAANIRPGSATVSPWPFRVRAQNGASLINNSGNLSDDYCAHLAGTLRLFDELIRLNLGNVAAYQTARTAAWNWLLAYPLGSTPNNWSNYFEDLPTGGNDPTGNNNQYSPGQTVRYLLDNRATIPGWQTKSATLIDWIETKFGGTDFDEPGTQYGAKVISEQEGYKFKMASHTSRFGAINALYAEATGDSAAKDKGFRSLNWATYMAREITLTSGPYAGTVVGSIIEGPREFIQNEYNWYSDGHGDYIRHFILGMGAFPEWAPAGENHLLRTTSVVKSITYATSSVTYTTYDAASTETLRISGGIQGVTAGGIALPLRTDLAAEGYTFSNGVLKIRHDSASDIVVTFDPALVAPNVSLSTTGTLLAPANITLTAVATDPGTVVKVEFFHGSDKLGEDTTAPYSFLWRNLPVGTYNVTAKATDDDGLTGTAAATLVIGTPAAAATLGSTSEGTATDFITDGSGAYINACRFTATANQRLTLIKARVGAITGTYQCALYSDNSGAPQTLLASTDRLTPTADGWQTFTLATPYDATTGTSYWLAIWSNDPAARVWADPTGTVRFALYPYATTWPNPISLTGGGTFTYSIYATGPGKTAFQQWKLNNALADTLGDQSDDDGDGLKLLVEYALGTDPATNDATPYSTAIDNDHLTLTYTKSKAATDVSVTAEVSADLATWSSAPADVDPQWQLVDGTTTQTITVRDQTSLSASTTKRFLRIKVFQP